MIYYQVEHMFRKFIKLYRANEAEWRPFLDDKGVGQPPMEFLVALEEGIREFASCVHCMGTRALRSRAHWKGKVSNDCSRNPFPNPNPNPPRSDVGESASRTLPFAGYYWASVPDMPSGTIFCSQIISTAPNYVRPFSSVTYP